MTDRSAGERVGTALFSVALAAAVAVGLYGRFVGLGTWALGVDESYISRSIDQILRSGLPTFPCGSFYSRGLLYQYVVALFREAGLSPELGARSVSALCSLVALVPAFLIGRRLHGRGLGWLLVGILLISVWEMEMARFGRMYAPFQAVFLWYLYFFLRYVLDDQRNGLVAMVILSVAGVLTWEGGVLLGVLNLLVPFVKLRDSPFRRTEWLYLVAMLILLALLYHATGDPRDGAAPAASDAVSAESAAASSEPSGTGSPLQHPVWLLAFLVAPAALTLHAGRWLWSLRARWMAAAGLALALTSALAHQFVLCGALVLLLLLIGLLDADELRARPARSYALAIGSSFFFWTAFAVATEAWRSSLLPSSPANAKWFALGQYLCGFPNVFREILVPWGRTLPLLTAGSIVLIAARVVAVIRGPYSGPSVERLLLVVLVVMGLAVGAREPDRIETRYTFFLYPLILALGFRAIFGLADAWFTRAGTSLAAAVSVSALLYCLAEDFQPWHIAHIDSWQTNFRVGMSASRASHYYPRADFRMVGEWLKLHVRPTDRVMLGIPAIDQYYRRADFFFLQDEDPRYDVYVCASGDRERWTNLPLVYGIKALAEKVSEGGRLWLLLYPSYAEAVYEAGKKLGWRESIEEVTPDRSVVAVLINP